MRVTRELEQPADKPEVTPTRRASRAARRLDNTGVTGQVHRAAKA